MKLVRDRSSVRRDGRSARRIRHDGRGYGRRRGWQGHGPDNGNDGVRRRRGHGGQRRPDRCLPRAFPYAAAPVGALRWQPPQPAASWQGTRKAVTFGPRCMQANLYSDMVFRDEPSEDCLYLNVWTPATSPSDRLPVMVWIHGGGFQAGSSSEPRQDGERLASKGVVVVSMNYRMGAFGFLAHPDLTKEAESTRVGQLRAARHGGGTPVGQGEHRRVRRRSVGGDDLW